MSHAILKLFKCGLNRSWYRTIPSADSSNDSINLVPDSSAFATSSATSRHASTLALERVAHSGVQGITGLMLSNLINPPRSHHCVIKVGHQSQIDRSIPRTRAFVGSVRQSCRNSCGPGTQLASGSFRSLRLILAKPSRNGRVNQQGATEVPRDSHPNRLVRTGSTTPASPTFRFRSQAELRPVAIRQLPIPHRRARR